MAVAKHISRETRLLVIAALIAVAVLWILARVRFPDRAATPNPVQPLFTQIAPPPRFDDLAAEVLGARMRLGEALLSIPVSGGRAAMAIRPGLAVAWLQDAVDIPATGSVEVVAIDPESGVGLVRTGRSDAVTLPPIWMPGNLDEPRYLMVTDLAGNRISLRPVFIGTLVPVPRAGWPGNIWLLPAHADLHPGNFVFSSTGELVGLVVSHGAVRALVPGDVLVNGTAWVEAADPAP